MCSPRWLRRVPTRMPSGTMWRCRSASPWPNDRPAEVIAALIDAGADPNAAEDGGWTAFHWAASHANSPHVVAALAAAGANPNAANDRGWTPLHVATRDNSPAVVRALVDVGANPHRRTAHGWTALKTATVWGNPGVAGEILRLHLPGKSLTEDGHWRRKGLHEAACWFEHDRAWPPKACYYLVVNEDPDDGASPLIGFPVVRFRARGAAPQDNPILHLGAGGPGRAMDFERDPYWIWSTYRALALGSGRDLYVIDPRGAGMSYPRLHCGDVLERLRDGLAKNLSPRADGMLWTTAYAACKTRLDTEGRNLDHYNSATVAADVEALRRALGVRQWVLLGHSYAARYALTIARDLPSSVEAMVLAAASLPGLPSADTHARAPASSPGTGLRPVLAHRRLRRGLPSVPLLGTRSSLRRGPARLDRSGDSLLPLCRAPRTDRDAPRAGRVSLPCTTPSSSRYSRSWFSNWRHGRTSILERHVLRSWFHTLLDETYSAPVRAAHYCGEDEPFVDSEAAAGDAKATNKHVRRLAAIRFEMETQRCRTWDVTPAPSVDGGPVRTSIPTLLLQGALDPITPVDHLEAQLGNFTNHEVLIFDDGSHWGSVAGRCAMEAAAHFVRHKRLEERFRQCAAPPVSSLRPE